MNFKGYWYHHVHINNRNHGRSRPQIENIFRIDIKLYEKLSEILNMTVRLIINVGVYCVTSEKFGCQTIQYDSNQSSKSKSQLTSEIVNWNLKMYMF